MLETDIRPQHLFDKYLELVQGDASLLATNTEREQVPCPACGAHDFTYAFTKSTFAYLTCNACSSLYQSPRPTHESLSNFYAHALSSQYWANTFFPAVSSAREKAIFAPRVQKIKSICESRHLDPFSVADIGAGHGIFLDLWRQQMPSTQTIAVEPNPDMASICRGKNIHVIDKMAEDVPDSNGIADLVTCFEVIEHVHDCLRFMKSLRRLVRPNGLIVVTGLSGDGYDIQLLWEKSKSVTPPHHLNFLSCLGLQRLAERSGFTNIEITTPGQLDVDIVNNNLNMISTAMQRFHNTLIGRGQEALQSFQQFLAANRLSSHVWIVANS